MILEEKSYVQKAEKVMGQLSKVVDKHGNVQMVTTSQVRNLLSMTADIYNDVRIAMDGELSPEVILRIEYLKIRFIYEAGRDTKVKNFVERSQIIEALNEIGDSRDRYILFSRYMEALVAYHKFMGGRDK